MSALITSQDFLNSKEWCNAVIESLFKNLDTDKDGVMIKDVFNSWDKIIEHYQSRSSPEAIAAFKESSSCQRALMEGKEKYSELDFLAMMAEIAAGDMKRMFLEGNDPILAKTTMTFFDLVDIDKDRAITKEEFFEGYKLLNWSDAAIEMAYNIFDKDGVGKITREKMEEVTYEYWYKTNYESN